MLAIERSTVIFDSWDTQRQKRAQERLKEYEDRHGSAEQQEIRELRRLLAEALAEIERLQAAGGS